MRGAGILNFIGGYYVVCCRDGAALANLLLGCGAVTWKASAENGCYRVCVSREHFKKLAPPPDFKFESVREAGLPKYLGKYRRRPGIAVGALLFCAILYLSTLFIWSIDIKGNEKFTKDEISQKLGELGCGVGSFMPGIDFYALCNSYLASNSGVSWISVNMRGTVAYVELREREEPEREVKSAAPANIVAASDGIVERVEVHSGLAAVKAGEAVRKGQLLISGVIDSSSVGFRAVRAEGKVIARTAAVIKASVPYQTQEKAYTGRAASEKTVKIFGKSINLFLRGRNLYNLCDTIESSGPVTVFDDIILPVTVKTVTYAEYEMKPRLLSEEEAKATAYDLLYEKFAARFANSEILSRVIEAGPDGDGTAYNITCEVSCSEDIGVTKEITNY